MQFYYSTRSFLPSKSANSVQSAHMASAWSQSFPDALTVYRTKSPSLRAADHFSPYGLTAPECALPISSRPLDDCFHFYLFSLRSLLAKRHKDALLYTRSTRMAWVGLNLGLEVVLELHDPLIPIRVKFLKKAFSEERIRVLVVTTQRLKEDVVRIIGLSPSQVLVAGAAAAADYVDTAPLALERSSKYTFHVGYAGSAFRGKGVATILACARAMPDVAFHLIGPSKEECRRLGPAGENIILHGYHTGHNVIGLLKSMDALLLPNQPSVIIRSGADIGQHTSPLKLYEYMSTGRPIIASNLPVFESILADGENCVLAEPSDRESFSSAISRLRSDPLLGQSIASAALTQFKSRYTWGHRVDSIVEFLGNHGFNLRYS